MTAAAQFSQPEISRNTTGDTQVGVNQDTVAHLYAEPATFSQALVDSRSNAPVDHVVGPLTLVDSSKQNDSSQAIAKCDDTPAAHPSKGFWQRLSEAFADATYAEAGMVPPSAADTTSGNQSDAGKCTAGLIEAPPAAAKPQVNLGDLSARTEHTGPAQNNGDSTVRLGETPAARPAEAPAARPAESTHAPEAAPHAPEATAPSTAARPGQENLNPMLKSVLENVGKPVQELEHGINPRLGCVRMLSHAMHEADPSFPETNNTAEFRRLLKAHGYEAVTVKPGDAALSQSQPGDVVVGARPDGMPSHVALNMGDGHVFNNNSDSGKGQIDSLGQFNQGMHDSKGHFNKDGFQSVTIYRKHAPAAVAA